MKIQHHKPYAQRGVTQLTYIGDDDAVETATQSKVVQIAKIVGIVWVAHWIFDTWTSERWPRKR